MELHIAENMEEPSRTQAMIHSCGLKGVEIVSLSSLLRKSVPMEEVKKKTIDSFESVFALKTEQIYHRSSRRPILFRSFPLSSEERPVPPPVYSPVTVGQRRKSPRVSFANMTYKACSRGFAEDDFHRWHQ